MQHNRRTHSSPSKLVDKRVRVREGSMECYRYIMVGFMVCYRYLQAHLSQKSYNLAVKDLERAVRLATPDERGLIQAKLREAQAALAGNAEVSRSSAPPFSCIPRSKYRRNSISGTTFSGKSV
jgi:hypothetical protein